jgi:hypothetical protein
MELRKFVATTIREYLNENKLDTNNLQNIDLDNLINKVKNDKFVEFLYVSEFPDITIINIPHYFSKTNNYIIIETHILQQELIKNLNTYFKKYNIKVFVRQKLDERYYSIIAQPINFNLSGLEK